MYQVQVSDYNSGGPKRPRTGAKSEDDWKCPNCGNVNFAFRTVCNIRKCSTPKPAEGSGPPYNNPPALYEQPPGPAYVSGPVTPAPIAGYVQTGTYNSPMMVNPSTSPYGVAPPPSYAPQGTYIMNGMPGPGYGAPVDNYGMSRGPLVMEGPPLGRALMPYSSPQDAKRKRRGGPEGGSEGDWKCPLCGNINFAFRVTCNMRDCSEPRPAEATLPYQGTPPNPRFNGGAVRPPTQRQAPPDGSWTCKCGNVNYPFRTHCNRKNCGEEKPSEAPAPGTGAAAAQ